MGFKLTEDRRIWTRDPESFGELDFKVRVKSEVLVRRKVSVENAKWSEWDEVTFDYVDEKYISDRLNEVGKVDRLEIYIDTRSLNAVVRGWVILRNDSKLFYHITSNGNKFHKSDVDGVISTMKYSRGDQIGF